MLNMYIVLISAYKPFQLHDTFINMDPEAEIAYPPPHGPALPPLSTFLDWWLNIIETTA